MTTKTKHGFPRVPGQVNDAHVMRRYLQDLRGALIESQNLQAERYAALEKANKTLVEAVAGLTKSNVVLKKSLADAEKAIEEITENCCP